MRQGAGVLQIAYLKVGMSRLKVDYYFIWLDADTVLC